jgi:hypothetical protein
MNVKSSALHFLTNVVAVAVFVRPLVRARMDGRDAKFKALASVRDIADLPDVCLAEADDLDPAIDLHALNDHTTIDLPVTSCLSAPAMTLAVQAHAFLSGVPV